MDRLNCFSVNYLANMAISEHVTNVETGEEHTSLLSSLKSGYIRKYQINREEYRLVIDVRRSSGMKTDRLNCFSVNYLCQYGYI